MTRKFLLPLIMLFVFAGCNSKTAFNYSQDIVKKEQSLVPEISMAEMKVSRFVGMEQYDSIGAEGARMEKLIDQKLNEIKDAPAPDVKEGTSFKDASLKYFRFIKSRYTCYKDLGAASTPEAREVVIARLKKIEADKDLTINEMQAAQKKFAEANGFKLEKK